MRIEPALANNSLAHQRGKYQETDIPEASAKTLAKLEPVLDSIDAVTFSPKQELIDPKADSIAKSRDSGTTNFKKGAAVGGLSLVATFAAALAAGPSGGFVPVLFAGFTASCALTIFATHGTLSPVAS